MVELLPIAYDTRKKDAVRPTVRHHPHSKTMRLAVARVVVLWCYRLLPSTSRVVRLRLCVRVRICTWIAHSLVYAVGWS